MKCLTDKNTYKHIHQNRNNSAKCYCSCSHCSSRTLPWISCFWTSHPQRQPSARRRLAYAFGTVHHRRPYFWDHRPLSSGRSTCPSTDIGSWRLRHPCQRDRCHQWRGSHRHQWAYRHLGWLCSIVERTLSVWEWVSCYWCLLFVVQCEEDFLFSDHQNRAKKIISSSTFCEKRHGTQNRHFQQQKDKQQLPIKRWKTPP